MGTSVIDTVRMLENRIVELQQANERLARELEQKTGEEHFRAILANTSITMFTMDGDFRYTWVFNPLPGLRADQLTGKQDEDLFDADTAAILNEPKRLVLASGHGVRREVSLSFRGQALVEDVLLEPLRGPSGEITGLAGIWFDVTEHHRLEARTLEYLAKMEVQRRLLDQREMERLQIARDLHDGPLQELLGLMLAIGAATGSTVDPDQKKRMQSLYEGAQTLAADLREACNELRPPTLVHFGLEQTIRSHAEKFRRNHPAHHLRLHFGKGDSKVSGSVRLALYRIYQESLNNIVRHASASRIAVRLEVKQGWVTLKVQDDGQGFEMPADWLEMARQGHLGLVGMKERAEAVGGSLSVVSSPGKGTQVLAAVPVMGVSPGVSIR
jgi:PAS domain S-box-containing protein